MRKEKIGKDFTKIMENEIRLHHKRDGYGLIELRCFDPLSCVRLSLVTQLDLISTTVVVKNKSEYTAVK